jgi:hypothetical protein
MNIGKSNRSKVVACLAALLVAGLMAGTASADVLGNCTVTGYTFMGGGTAYQSTAAGPNTKNYFLAQPLNYDFGGMNMWGYGWAKFDVGTETVSDAYLVIDLIGVGAMGLVPATPAAPGILDIYDPGATDVAGLGTATQSQRKALRDTLDTATPLVGAFTMTSDGTYAIDITDIYNDWVNGTIANNGLIFSTIDGGSGTGYASFRHSTGSAPYISTVPEPATMALLAMGGLATVLRRRRKG